MTTYTLEQQKILQQYKELNAEELKHLKIKAKYESENKITLFNTKAIPANPPQEKLLKAWENLSYKIFTFFAANQVGKTTIAAIIAFATAFGFWPWSDEEISFPHNKPRKVRYIGQGWEDHINQVVVPKFREWWPLNRVLITKKNNQGVDYLWIDKKTGSSLNIMSNNQEIRHFEGWEGDLVIGDEPIRKEVWTANARGLIARQGKALFVATLLGEAWMSRELAQKKLQDGRPDRSVFNVTCDIYANLGYGLTLGGIEQFKDGLSDVDKQARIQGIPSYMQGLVLPPFNREIHLKPRFRNGIPTDWLIDIEIDVHPRERQAVLFIATNPRNERWLCDEIWMHGDGTALGHAIVRRILQHGYSRVNYIEIDPLAKSDSNNDDTTRGKVDKVLRNFALNNKWFNPRPPTNTSYEEGIFCVGIATKDKDSGILAIKDHLMGANDESSIWIFDDLIRTIYEIEGWMYDKDTQLPQKKDDHMMECWYRAMLLKTMWYEPEEEDDEDSRPPKSTVRTWATGGGTGY